MSLLDKFAAVEVKAESRISPSDKDFCIVHQEAYDHLRKALTELLEFVEERIRVREAIVKRAEPDFSISAFGSVSPAKIRNELMESHEDFISKLTYHFSSKYNVTLDSNAIKEILVPKKPSNGCYSRNKAEWDAYVQEMSTMRITYESILDQIFVQLGGCSFQDKALNELKEAAHVGAWNRYHGIKCYEQKKAVITFTSYACHWDTWYSGPHISLSDSMKSIVRAVSHFETGTMDYLPWGFRELCGYSFERSEFDLDMDKVKSVKCFKNGRVDIRFTSEAYAREFIELYLGLEA